MKYCDLYIFCLWKLSLEFWEYIVRDIANHTSITFMKRSRFPLSMPLLREFYGNVPLEGGYDKKLADVNGEFLFIIVHDKEMNNYPKIIGMKKRYRSLDNRVDGYRLLHSSVGMKEFSEELKVLERLPWH